MSNLRISFTNAAPVSMGMRIVGIQGPPGTGGGGVTDGDKGGIVVTGSGAVWTVKDGTITDLMLSSSAIALFAAASHTHIIANITGLQAALDGKAAAAHTHVAADVTDFAATTRATTLTGYAAAGSRTALAAADTILGAFGKVGKWLADLAAIAFSGSASDLSAGTVPAARLPAMTGDVTASAGSHATTIANNAVTNAKAADMATATIKGRATAGTGDPEDLSAAQAWGIIDDAALDTAQNFTKAQGVTPVALTDGANIATDASLSNVFTVTLGGNRTLDNPTNLVAGRTYAWIVTQDGAGGRTLAYGSYFDFPGGTAPTLSTGIGDVDLITGIAISSSRLLCVANLDFS